LKLSPHRSSQQGGAALLSALLIVSLVASLSAAALWQQWRLTEVERHERGRQQSDWILNGAMDWARLILREDARSGGADHLGEPWAVALQEARLSSFLAGQGNSEGLDALGDVFLSGRVEDMQGRLNLRNLVDRGKISGPDLQMAQRLFQLFDLPEDLASQTAQRLQQALPERLDKATPVTAFLPQRPEQLVWLGLSEAQLSVLAPHISLLPERTALNLNTASAELLHAALGLPLGEARRMVERRQRQPWKDLAQAQSGFGPKVPLSTDRHSVATRYFRVTGWLRQEDLQFSQQALMLREGLQVRVLWRDNRVQPLVNASK